MLDGVRLSGAGRELQPGGFVSALRALGLGLAEPCLPSGRDSANGEQEMKGREPIKGKTFEGST